MWLAPIAGTRLMVPYRISLPTPLGQGVLQATQFVTVPQVDAADADQRQALAPDITRATARLDRG